MILCFLYGVINGDDSEIKYVNIEIVLNTIGQLYAGKNVACAHPDLTRE